MPSVPLRPSMLLVVALLLATGMARAAPWELVGERVRVVYADAGLEPYARRVLARAERALPRVEALFGARLSEPLTVTLDGRDDAFNAMGLPLPRPTAALRARFPTEARLGLRGPDPLLLLLVHEVVHVVQFAARPPPGRPNLGLLGESLPLPPPAWLLEGLAVWAESRLADGGGRLGAPGPRGLLRTLAAGDAWPSLADAGLLTHGAWPGGRTRYLLGGAFVAHLIERHGHDALLRALSRYERGLPWPHFEAAWQAEAGTALRAEWRAFRQRWAEEARAARADGAGTLPRVGAPVGELSAPAVSPGGARLAWVEGGAVRVAAWDGTRLQETRTVRRGLAPARLAWRDADTLIYARVAPGPAARPSDLYALDLTSGRERRLTRGAHAFLPAPLPDGCSAYVRDTEPAGSALWRACPDGASAPLVGAPRLPRGTRWVGLAASSAGRLAAVAWRDGRNVLWVSDGGGWRRVALPLEGVAEPDWTDERTLLVRADGPDGVPAVYRIGLGEPGAVARVVRLGRSVGGLRAPAGGVAVETRSEGRTLVRLPPAGTRVAHAMGPAEGGGAARTAPSSAAEAHRYRPWRDLAPVGWLPSARLTPQGLRVGVTALARDALGRHGWDARVGLAPGLVGPLGPLRAEVRYRYRPLDAFRPVRRPGPFTASVGLGLWPYRPYGAAAVGVRPTLDAGGTWTVARDPFVALAGTARWVHLPGGSGRLGGRAELHAAHVRVDPWGVPSRGARARLVGLADPLVGGGWSTATWGEASVWAPGPLGAVWGAEARTGVAAPAVPPTRALAGLGGAAAVRARWTVPVRWRLGDGGFAWERLRVAPAVGARADASGGRLAGGLAVAADLVLAYHAPVSVEVGVRVGDGTRWRVGVSGAP